MKLIHELLRGMKRKPADQKRVDERLAQMLCLGCKAHPHCDERCDQPGGAGGKCPKCYSSWRTNEHIGKTRDDQFANRIAEERAGRFVTTREWNAYRRQYQNQHKTAAG